jgi:hypothetical protein
MDPLYLQAISELENEHHVAFPPELVKTLADKTFHSRVCVMGYETYQCAHPLNNGFWYHYCQPLRYPDPEEGVIPKTEIYKRYIKD